ncbi:MBL fold metallo-hydrolase [Kitasatospora sp. GP82]|uniref:MBL fold metallo-hydrolase n=1 Tax=Kitasatospora sp. GP82 TaxID=3035089 RepID=UPI002475F003|nr:MBL fold metallo-hydrolase [Kitasatospora sp. GP82]MDH6123934.1 glyoxylase-like metal-dependent hydrolase (beta-lactamase superfamily II) [Kitasatospora sp. GP82]
METVEILPELYLLGFEVGHAYLWRDPDGLTLIDTGVVGSGALIAEAIRSLGHGTDELRRIVLTHCHQDHVGSTAEITAWGSGGGVEVMAHRLDAPVIRGERPMPPPVFDDAPVWERELWEGMTRPPAAPPARVDVEVEDGDVLDFGGGAQVVAVPGHTDGSIALHLPGPGVLFTGDAVAGVGGQPILGVFNLDRARAIESFRRLAELDAAVAVFGHGEPITSGTAAAMRAAAATAR